ncbi:serine/threonine-protein kinase [Geodermatophilus sabuli]|uniref:non-specific serine/threonine protein kinase n=1 Tax=Geodermatophilus sabuli TaxID=1564158 RepID=A0A285EER3_9ACTN|nr:serine/threonine-protein kinase [Geodermatophilus sabuli]MBB3086294.1 serine/threonine-protein kinase [Geodermatophilus sabuli]SNX97490.1 serine/threonine protein kinase [Geodermatophilus sabuli]
MALSTGTILAGRYEITAPIATGGMGEVWRARDRVLDRVVAAKVLRSEFTGDPSFVARFRNEARHTAALSHPNIASVYDYGETDDERGGQLAFLVMELVEGKPLVTILHEEGKLPVDWTLHVLSQSADGLSAAHKAGVVHRDIKPGNLIVRPDGVVKLTDFGIARARDATPLTRTGMVVGTAQYLSPEQAQGFEVTAASDVYSLGVVGYECLTGGRPFDGTSQVAVALAHINRPPPPLPGNVPAAVRLLIERALAKDPADRFADGAAFAAAIRSVAAGNGLSAAPLTGGTLPARPGPAPAPTPARARTELVTDISDSRTQVLGAASAGGTGGPGTAPGAMPPLRRPPEDDEPAGGPRHAERPRGGNRWVWLVAGLLLLALVGGGTWFLLAGDNDSPAGNRQPTSASSTSVSTAAGTFTVNTDEFIGQNVDTVEEYLVGNGLQVSKREADAAQVTAPGRAFDAGDVVTSDPANEAVPLGTVVTLYYAPDDYAPDTGDDTSGDTGGDTQPQPTSATPTPTQGGDDDGGDDDDGRPTGRPGGGNTTTATATTTAETQPPQPTQATTSPAPGAPAPEPPAPQPGEPAPEEPQAGQQAPGAAE